MKVHPLGVYRGAASFTPTYFLNKYAVLFYSSFNLLLSLFYTDRFISINLFNYYCLNSTMILLCLCVYSLCNYYVMSLYLCLCVCYVFVFIRYAIPYVNLILICRNNNLYIRLHFILRMTLMKKSKISKMMWYWCGFTLTSLNGFLINPYYKFLQIEPFKKFIESSKYSN